jgi:Flp pilus assembly protein TadD
MTMLVLPDPSVQTAYHQTPVSSSLTDPWAAMGLAIILLALYLWLIQRKVGLMAAAVLLSFIPMANIVRVAAPFDMGFPMSERFLYLPSMVLALFVGVAWTQLLGHLPTMSGRLGRLAAAGMVVLLTGGLSLMTHARNPAWKNEAAMFSDARSKTEDAPLLDWLYAGVLRREGKLNEAHLLLLDAVQTARKRGGEIPPEMIITLANTTASKGQIKRAIQVLHRYTRETGNTDPMIAYNLGVLQVETGRLGSAIKSFDYACRNRPNYLPAFLARGLLHMKRGRHALALQSFEHVIELDPRHPGAWHGAGIAHRELGDHSRSLKALLRAVEFGPEAANPRIDAAAALLATDPARALELVETGAAMHPEDVRMAAALKIIRSQAGQ